MYRTEGLFPPSYLKSSPHIIDQNSPLPALHHSFIENFHQGFFCSHYNLPCHFGDQTNTYIDSSQTSPLLRHSYDYHHTPITKNCPDETKNKRSRHINIAFSALRDCIPNVPTDTKLSKIKTLRLATSYIGYLMEVLKHDDPNSCKPFGALVLKEETNRERKRKKDVQV